MLPILTNIKTDKNRTETSKVSLETKKGKLKFTKTPLAPALRLLLDACMALYHHVSSFHIHTIVRIPDLLR